MSQADGWRGFIDIVYVCGPRTGEELRYSLRSLVNLAHDRVWLVGHKPSWVVGVEHLQTTNGQGSKYQASTANLVTACSHPDVSEEFVYFNDDQFILKPISAIPVLHRGPVADVIAYYLARYGQRQPPAGRYLRGMVATKDLLAELGHPQPMSYELHLPMVMEKAKVLDAVKRAIGRNIVALHKRTLYGNLAEVGGVEIEDVKLLTLNDHWPPDATFVSTTDKTFSGGVAGRMLRKQFCEPSPYERLET